jgi:hypothetical protein
MSQAVKYMNRAEVIDYLEVSEWKLKKILSEGNLCADRVVHSKYGKDAHLYNIFKVVALKRKLVKEGYKYRCN